MSPPAFVVGTQSEQEKGDSSMRRFAILGLLGLIATFSLLGGCSKSPRIEEEHKEEHHAAPIKPDVECKPDGQSPVRLASDQIVQPPPGDALAAADFSKEEKYNSALLDALGQLADKKYSQALAALEAARTLSDTDQVRLEIDKVKGLLDQQGAAERTGRDIEVVLGQGKPEEASQLAASALQQYGSTDAADPLSKLKREADAVTATQLNDDATRRDRFRQEGEAALRDKNYRAAAIAFETSLQFGDQPEVRRQLDDVQATLKRYDEARQRAFRLRRDPAQLEDAIAALQGAARAWDTLQVRQEIDDCNLALQLRRDRLSIADFEVRGDIGMPLAGKTIADELLPSFKSRFDLVERGQLGRVIDELKLESSDLVDNQEAHREMGRLANIRYLVVGSVTPMNGIMVNARLVDVRTGLIVQTARLVAASPEDLFNHLRQLATLLMMTDEQKLAYEHQCSRQDAPEIKPVAIAALPPAPEALVEGQPLPPPVIAYSPRPPAFGGLLIADFGRLAPPPDQPLVAVDVDVERDDPVGKRLLQVSVELGDNLFRRGRYQEAQRHFELAFRLGGGGVELGLRIDRCRPYLPPPPPPPPPPAPTVVVIAPPPPVVIVVAPPPARPRLVVFNFMVNCDPGLAPPAFGDWASDHFASCFGGTYEVVDRGEVSWYMGRLGITMRDVLTNPCARRGLAQALNVRFFAFGVIQQTASFNVTTHLIDAETGAKTGGGDIHVQDHQELKLRMHELIQQTVAKPEEQKRLQQAGKDNEKVLNNARQLLKAGKFADSADQCRDGLKRTPDSISLRTLLQQAEREQQQAALEESRKQAAQERQTATLDAHKRQHELIKKTAAARQRTEQDAKTQGDVVRRAKDQLRLRAYGQLLARGRQAMQQARYPQAVSAFESAVALESNDAGFKELAQAKAKLEESNKAHAALEQAAKDAAQRKQREAELAQAKAKVEEERHRRDAEQSARRKEQETRDQAEAARLVGVAKQQLAKQQYDAAVVSLNAARRLHKTEEVDRLLNQAEEAKARADAAKKGDQAKAEFEKKRAAQKAERDKADAEAKRKQQAYVAAVDQAQKAFIDKRYDQAIAKYQEADKLFHTDVVASGLRQAEEAKKRDAAFVEAENRKKADERKRADDLARWMAQGKAAVAASQFDKAVQAFTEAKKLAPGNVEVLTALTKAEQARDAQASRAQERKLEEQRAEQARQLVSRARTAMSAKQYDSAAKTLAEAAKVCPGDPAIVLAQRDLERARSTATADAEKQKRLDAYQAAIKSGRAALAGKRYDDAIKAATEASRLMPGDRDAAALLRDANKAKSDAKQASEASKKISSPPPPPPKTVPAEHTKQMQNGAAFEKLHKYADALKCYKEALRLVPGDAKAITATQFAQRMDNGQKAAAARKFGDAVREYQEALKLSPNNSDAVAALKRAKEGKP
jgi:tetratricopeptide (TPR) repeat protein